VTAYATHGVLSHGALSLIGSSDLKELVVTDTIQGTPPVLAHPKVRIVSLARLLAVAIARTAKNESVSGLFH
jgi:ribose-phosphate pyrophosphokinase